MTKVILDKNTPSVKYLMEKDRRFAKLVEMTGPVEYFLHEGDPFEFIVHEIIEQMLSIKAGAKISARVGELCGGVISVDTISRQSAERLKSCGMSQRKAEYILNVTDAIKGGELNLEALRTLSDKDVTSRLTRIKGVGNWTAKMYLMFILDRQDILPFEDGAFLQSYKWLYKTDDISPASIKKKCAKWRPYSSVAARFMYTALNMGLTKNEFHLYK